MEMIKSPPDVLFVPSHSIPLVHPPQTVTTVHDVVFLKYPELYDPEDLKNQLRSFNFAKQFAKKIIVPSKATRDDVVANGVDAERVVVVEHGVNNDFSESLTNIQAPESPNSSESYRIIRKIRDNSDIRENRFVLFIGRIEKKKNVMNLVHAFRKLIDAGKANNESTRMNEYQADSHIRSHSLFGSIKLVLAGSKGYGAEDVDLAIKTFKLEDRVIQLGWVDRDQYYSLLKNATLLVFPSFGEGFGLPVLEAMSIGVPVVCSDISVLHEVGGNAVEYVNPHNPKDIARGIITVLDNEMLQSEMIKRGKVRAGEYTWEKSAKSTWKILTGL